MISYNVSLRPYNTFGIDVTAAAFAVFTSVGELTDIIRENNGKLPLFILGGGSNILLTKPVNALVLRNEIKGIEIVSDNGNVIHVKAGAGEVWHSFVRHCVENGWGGLENLSLIPGSVGASPMQNIGAYGVEIKDRFVSLEAWHIEAQQLRTFTAEECRFGYRESVFKRELKDQYVIISVTYSLSRQPELNTTYGAISAELSQMGVKELSIDAVSQAVMNIRKSKLPDPTILGNAGSFFKNPVVSSEQFEALKVKYPEMPNYPQEDGTVKLAAGWLIEQSGWKGKRLGNCGVHEKQALVLVNYGGATGDEVFALSQAVLDEVKNRFGVILEREVNIY